MSKKIWITTGVVAAAIGVTAMVAHAERGRYDGQGYHGRHHGGYDEDRHERRGWRGRWRRQITKDDFDARTRARFAKWDANSDGVVDADEVQMRIADRMERRHRRRGGRRWERMLRRVDADRDGKVTKAEAEARITELFERMDLDGDGRITDVDLPPMMRDRNVLDGEAHMGRRWGRRHHRHHGRRARGRARMKRMLHRAIAANTNKDGAVTLQEMQDHSSKRFARFDRNQDGTIDQADRDALSKEIVDYRVARFLHRFGGGTDGKLTAEQFNTYRDARFAKRDLDGDGIIERSEMRRHRGRGRGHWGRSRDGDRDGRRRDRRERGNRDNQ